MGREKTQADEIQAWERHEIDAPTMGEPLPKQGRDVADRAIRVFATVSVLAVVCVGGWISYQHGTHVVTTYGSEDPSTAPFYMASVDGLIMVSSSVLLWCARYGLTRPKLAVFCMASGITVTLAPNMLHGLDKGTLSGVIAGWPALSMVLSYELLMWVVQSGRELKATGQRSRVVTAERVPTFGRMFRDLFPKREQVAEIEHVPAFPVPEPAFPEIEAEHVPPFPIDPFPVPEAEPFPVPVTFSVPEPEHMDAVRNRTGVPRSRRNAGPAGNTDDVPEIARQAVGEFGNRPTIRQIKTLGVGTKKAQDVLKAINSSQY